MTPDIYIYWKTRLDERVPANQGPRWRKVNKKIVFGVTADYSIPLLGDLPGELSEQGWEVHVVANPGTNLSSCFPGKSIKRHGIPMKRDSSPFSDLGALVRWFLLLRKVNPAVVAVGTPKAGFLGLIAARLNKVPVRLYTLRGLRLEGSKGLQNFMLGAVEKLSAASATNVLAVSPSLLSAYLKLNLTQPQKISVLGAGSSKGVDSERFRPPRPCDESTLENVRTAIGISGTHVLIGYFGRINDDKGLPILVEALRIVASQGLNFQLLIVGDYELQKFSGMDFSIPNTQVFLRPETKEIEVMYRLLDIFCLPTLREGLPNVALEAQASGVPVITTDATGSIDAVLHGVTGMVVQKGNSQALAEALKSLITNTALRTTLAQNSREWVMKNFDSRLVLKRQIRYFSDLVKDLNLG